MQVNEYNIVGWRGRYGEREMNIQEKIQNRELMDRINYERAEGERVGYLKAIADVRKEIIGIPTDKLAQKFHKEYERSAIENQWKTQQDCQVDFEDLPAKNKQTMLETAMKIKLWLAKMAEVKDGQTT